MTKQTKVVVENFRSGSWTFTTVKGPILSSADARLWERELDLGPVDRLPDAVFGYNKLSIKFAAPDRNVEIAFVPFDVLRGTILSRPPEGDWPNFCIPCVDGPNNENIPRRPPVPVAQNSDAWKERSAKIFEKSPEEFRCVPAKFDWSFASMACGRVINCPIQSDWRQFHAGTSKFCLRISPNFEISTFDSDDDQLIADSDIFGIFGQLPPAHMPTRPATECVQFEHSGGLIPMKLLTDTSMPILYYQSVDLLEDDLGDCGLVRSTAKLRVMPTFWFALLRTEIRVDDVCIRQIDCRYFHLFGSGSLIRQFTWREATYSDLRKRNIKIGANAENTNQEKVGGHVLCEEDTWCDLTQTMSI